MYRFGDKPLNFSPEFDLSYFKVPGFEDLYEGWSIILSKDDYGRYIPAPDAINLMGAIHLSVQDRFKLDRIKLNELSGKARDYACRLMVDLEYEIRE